MRMEKVINPTALNEIEEIEKNDKIDNPPKGSKVISLADVKKK